MVGLLSKGPTSYIFFYIRVLNFFFLGIVPTQADFILPEDFPSRHTDLKLYLLPGL